MIVVHKGLIENFVKIPIRTHAIKVCFKPS